MKITYKDLECEWCHGSGEISRYNSDVYACDECNGSGVHDDVTGGLLESLESIMNHIDEKRLVRNIEDDDKPDFALRQVSLILDLKHALDVIRKANKLKS